MNAGKQRDVIIRWLCLGVLVTCLLAAALASISLISPRDVRSVTSGETSPPTRVAIRAWHKVEDFSKEIAQFDTVFWEPEDTTSIRAWIKSQSQFKDKQVLEIGSGTGLLALCCAQQGARVVTIDVNQAAVWNSQYNAEHLGLSAQIDVRWLSDPLLSPFSLLDNQKDEGAFDYIISNPPWEDAPIESVDQFALYDPGFQLCDRLLAESQRYLKRDGKLLLVYGAQTAIEHIISTAHTHGWQVKIMDDRDLKSLPEVFLPAMMIELTPLSPNDPRHENARRTKSSD